MKYYAVKKGRKIGIYKTWNECKINVLKYPGAKYKSFSTYEEAEQYMSTKPGSITEQNLSHLVPYNQNDNSYIVIKGVFNPITNTYGYGALLITRNRCIPLQGTYDKVISINQKEIIGEIFGIQVAIEMAIKLNIKHIKLCYDDSMIKALATGMVEPDNNEMQKFQAFIQLAKKKIQIDFVKNYVGLDSVLIEEVEKLSRYAVGFSNDTAYISTGEILVSLYSER